MKSPQGQKTKQPVSVHRLKKDAFASTESIRVLSKFLWLPPQKLSAVPCPELHTPMVFRLHLRPPKMRGEE